MPRSRFQRFAALAAAAVLSLGAVACADETGQEDVQDNPNAPENAPGTEGPLDPTSTLEPEE